MAPVTKKVKSREALNKQALASGATVTDGAGQKFNASKTVAKPIPRLEKDPDAKQIPPAPPAPEPEPGPDAGSVLVADKIMQASKVSAMMIAELKKQISQIQLSNERPILDWDFEFIRDNKGYLTRIKAHAEIVQPTLN